MHLSHHESSIHCITCIIPDFLDQIHAIPLSEPDASGLSVVNFKLDTIGRVPRSLRAG